MQAGIWYHRRFRRSSHQRKHYVCAQHIRNCRPPRLPLVKSLGNLTHCVQSLVRQVVRIFDCRHLIRLDYSRRHWRDIKAYLASSTTSTVQSALVLLVESGLLYCAVWVRRWYFPACRDVSNVRDTGTIHRHYHAQQRKL